MTLRKAPEDLPEFYRKKETRIVNNDRTVKFNGRIFEAPIGLIGQQVTLQFENYDRIEVFLDEVPKGFQTSSDVKINSRVKRVINGSVKNGNTDEKLFDKVYFVKEVSMDNLRHFFGLKKDPFPQNIPVKDLYPLPSLALLEKRVFFAIEQKAISVITGDVGSGKSTSLRYVCSKCHQSAYHQIPVIGGGYSLMELYRQILLSFGIEFHSYQISMIIQKIRELILEIVGRKMVPLLIIDKAHLLKKHVFTQLHTLIQFEYDSRLVMPVILCGQELLIDHLMMNSSRPLASRILGRNHLESIKKEVMDEYLDHHLKLAGCSKKIIRPNFEFLTL